MQMQNGIFLKPSWPDPPIPLPHLKSVYIKSETKGAMTMPKSNAELREN